MQRFEHFSLCRHSVSFTVVVVVVVPVVGTLALLVLLTVLNEVHSSYTSKPQQLTTRDPSRFITQSEV